MVTKEKGCLVLQIRMYVQYAQYASGVVTIRSREILHASPAFFYWPKMRYNTCSIYGGDLGISFMITGRAFSKGRPDEIALINSFIEEQKDTIRLWQRRLLYPADRSQQDLLIDLEFGRQHQLLHAIKESTQGVKYYQRYDIMYTTFIAILVNPILRLYLLRMIICIVLLLALLIRMLSKCFDYAVNGNQRRQVIVVGFS